MKVQRFALVAVLSVLPIAMGCGHFRNLLFRPGAPCNACAGCLQGRDIAPPAIPNAYGEPGCGAIPPVGLGCGGETYGSYYGGTHSGYPTGGNVIGDPAVGSAIYPGAPPNGYIPDNWVAPGERVVPDSMQTYESPQSGPMTPTNPNGQ
jgi:hypothetical protein